MTNILTRLSDWINGRKLVWLMLLVLVVTVLVIVLTPVFLIMPLFVLEDYWFDWRNYHPDTSIYSIGPR